MSFAFVIYEKSFNDEGKSEVNIISSIPSILYGAFKGLSFFKVHKSINNEGYGLINSTKFSNKLLLSAVKSKI